MREKEAEEEEMTDHDHWLCVLVTPLPKGTNPQQITCSFYTFLAKMPGPKRPLSADQNVCALAHPFMHPVTRTLKNKKLC